MILFHPGAICPPQSHSLFMRSATTVHLPQWDATSMPHLVPPFRLRSAILTTIFRYTCFSRRKWKWRKFFFWCTTTNVQRRSKNTWQLRLSFRTTAWRARMGRCPTLLPTSVSLTSSTWSAEGWSTSTTGWKWVYKLRHLIVNSLPVMDQG